MVPGLVLIRMRILLSSYFSHTLYLYRSTASLEPVVTFSSSPVSRTSRALSASGYVLSSSPILPSFVSTSLSFEGDSSGERKS